MPMDKHIRRWLTGLMGPGVAFDEPMAGHTYFKVGGPADALAVPKNPEVLAALIRGAARRDLPFRVIGDGTNLLVTDAGIRGMVIALTAGFDTIRQAPGTGGDVRVTAMAGAKLQTLCRFAAGSGLAGMNFAAGIPGTVGGAMMMNAGTAAGEMADAVTAVSVMDAQGEIRTLDKSRLSFGYRCMHWPPEACCGLQGGPILIDGSFALRRNDPDRLKAERQALIDRRRRIQPAGLPSAGCFFKNPETGQTAGQLIERAGLKGKTMGGAQVSVKHANFIVNRGGATAGDILKLSRLVRETVSEKFGIELEPEVKIVGA